MYRHRIDTVSIQYAVVSGVVSTPGNGEVHPLKPKENASTPIGPIATTPVRTGPMTQDVAVPTDEEMEEPPPEEAWEGSERYSDVSVASQDSDGVARIAFLTTRVEGLKTKAAGKRRKEKRGREKSGKEEEKKAFCTFTQARVEREFFSWCCCLQRAVSLLHNVEWKTSLDFFQRSFFSKEYLLTDEQNLSLFFT